MLFEFIGSHLRVIIAVLSSFFLKSEVTLSVKVSIINIATRYKHSIVVVITRVVHSIIKAVFSIIWSETIEIFIVMQRLDIVEFSVQVILGEFLLLDSLGVF